MRAPLFSYVSLRMIRAFGLLGYCWPGPRTLLAVALAAGGGLFPGIGRAELLVIDDFDSGPVSLTACGTYKYAYHESLAILGGNREVKVRDAHSCSLGGSAHLDIVASLGYADAYGRTAADQRFQYGSFVGHTQFGWPYFAVLPEGPNSGNAAPLNLALTPDHSIQLDLLDFPDVQPYLYIQLHSDSFPWAFTRGYTSFTVGTNLLPLTGFTDPWGAPMPASVYENIDGILVGIYPFSNSATMSNTPGTGFRIDRLGIKSPVSPIDCVVSDWSQFDACSASCGGGTQTRTRTVVIEPAYGGDACPALSESQACNTHSCDSDDDGVPEEDDLCPNTSDAALVDAVGCSGAQNIAAACPTTGTYKNHGAYVSCVAKAGNLAVLAGLITQVEKDAIVSAAAQSSVGK